MIPLRLTARNYGPYKHVSWTPAAGITAILGRNNGGEGISSNGAGKTKLLEILPIALYGPGLPWSEYLTLGTVEEKCEVKVEFSHGLGTYRVTRTYDPRGRGKTTLELDVVDRDPELPEPFWQALTRESQAETQRELDRILGMSEATFSQSVFAAQGAQHFADPALTPAQRKAVLAEALGLDEWDRYLAAATDERKLAELRLAELRTAVANRPEQWQLDSARDELAAIHAQQQELATEEAALAEQLAAERERERAYGSAHAERAAAEAARDAAKAEHRRLHDAREELVAARAKAEVLLPKIAEFSDLAAQVPQLEQVAARHAKLLQLRDEVRALEEQAAEYSTALRKLNDRIDGVVTLTLNTCDRCGQQIADEARAVTLRNLHAERDALTEHRDNLNEQADHRERSADLLADELPPLTAEAAALRLREAREAEQALARLETQYETLAAIITRTDIGELEEAYATVTEALAKAEAHLRSLPEVTFADTDRAVERQLETVRGKITMLAASEGAARQTLTDLEQRLASTETAQQDLAVAEQRLDDLKFMERMYGRDGIPALLLEAQAIPQIEAEAQRILRELGTNLRVELRTQRDLKTDDRKKETLDVVVCDDVGERSYASFSGGERTRINLALRIGLARMIASRKGASTGTLCLDEPSYLDAEGLRQLPVVLRSLTEFSVIMLISHDEALTDQVDHVVTVVKDGGEATLA